MKKIIEWILHVIKSLLTPRYYTRWYATEFEGMSGLETQRESKFGGLEGRWMSKESWEKKYGRTFTQKEWELMLKNEIPVYTKRRPRPIY